MCCESLESHFIAKAAERSASMCVRMETKQCKGKRHARYQVPSLWCRLVPLSLCVCLPPENSSCQNRRSKTKKTWWMILWDSKVYKYSFCNARLFRLLWEGVNSELIALLLHTDVKWLSRRKVASTSRRARFRNVHFLSTVRVLSVTLPNEHLMVGRGWRAFSQS